MSESFISLFLLQGGKIRDLIERYVNDKFESSNLMLAILLQRQTELKMLKFKE